MALGKEEESLAEFSDRMTNDPDSARRGWEADMLEDNDQEWVDENEKFYDAWWDVILGLHFGSDNIEAHQSKAGR